jgi:hypothetical protein
VERGEVALSQEEQPHDSAYVYSQIKGRHTLAVFPSLQPKERSRGQWVILALLIFMVVASAWGTAYELQLNVINRPATYTGVCPSPATVINGACYLSQTSTNSNGQTVVTEVPTGTICYPGVKVAGCP